MPTATFEEHLDPQQRRIFSGLNSPARIQAFLDQIPYSAENINRCPLSVLRDRVAHCLDGGLFAAAALRLIGHPPLIVDLLPAPGTDDDHVLAIYKCDGYLGAVAKSNMTGLRYREAIYRNLRELVLSYFEDYFNVDGEKTLRSYTRPLNLQTFDKAGWMWSDAGADAVERHFGRMRKIQLLSPAMVANLSPTSSLAFQAGMLGANEAGLYRPHS